jgi:hypothetical protein
MPTLAQEIADRKREHVRRVRKQGEIKAAERKKRNEHALRRALSLELARDQFSPRSP